jgi:mRNA-degrading endonuclease RelE of RelBE toxin-antitoxin system
LTFLPKKTIIIVIMVSGQPYLLVYDPVVKEHLRAVDSKYYSLIRREIESQLLFEPDVETRNRKPLRRSVACEATWELRLGPQNRFRVFYDVNQQGHQVEILAFGVKTRNRLTIGKKEVEL